VVATLSETRVQDRILTFTRDRIYDKIVDSAFNHEPLGAMLLGKLLGDFDVTEQVRGKVTQTGGESIVVRPNLGKSLNAKNSASQWSVVSNAPQDTVRLARENWRFYDGACTVSNHELRVNRGPEAISDLVSHYTQLEVTSVADVIMDDIWSVGTPTTEVVNIDLIASAATSTLHGLAVATYAPWHSRGISARGTAGASVSFTSGSFAVQGLQDLRTSFNNATEGNKRPHAGFTDWVTFGYLEGSIQPQERFQNTDAASVGFQTLAFKGRPCFASDKATSGYWYWLNFDHLRMIMLAGADFATEEFHPSETQKASTAKIEVECNLICDCRKYQNKLTGITA
jgi:hypothetical protein